MTYSYLGHALHETADHAKKYFASEYGAKKFVCEAAVEDDLPLRPTWQASLEGGYRLCIEVLETPFSETLHSFVTHCDRRALPVRLWVTYPAHAGAAFMKELKQARELGVGVAEITEEGVVTEHSKPVPLSLFGLRKTNLQKVPKKHRESMKSAEDAFLNGSPELGCQQICQELESVTRAFGQYSHDQKWWKDGKARPSRFFATDSWARMLEELDEQIDQKKVRTKCSSFGKAQVAGARQYTEWRNGLSHKPKTSEQRQERDARLRTMFEATRDLLIEWYEVGRALKLAL